MKTRTNQTTKMEGPIKTRQFTHKSIYKPDAKERTIITSLTMATCKYEDLKRKAAEKRKLLTQDAEENIRGLRSVLAVKVKQTEDNENISEERKRNREKHQSIIKWVTEVNTARQTTYNHKENWNQPVDWRLVTAKTLHRYIPVENKKIPTAEFFNHMMEQLGPYGPPSKRATVINDDTPIWFMTRNAIRKVLHKTLTQRRTGSTNL